MQTAQDTIQLKNVSYKDLRQLSTCVKVNKMNQCNSSNTTHMYPLTILKRPGASKDATSSRVSP